MVTVLLVTISMAQAAYLPNSQNEASPQRKQG
jgi:hypothetical protein